MDAMHSASWMGLSIGNTHASVLRLAEQLPQQHFKARARRSPAGPASLESPGCPHPRPTSYPRRCTASADCPGAGCSAPVRIECKAHEEISLPQLVHEHADARPCFELDERISCPDCKAAADMVDSDRPSEKEQRIYRHLVRPHTMSTPPLSGRMKCTRRPTSVASLKNTLLVACF